MQHNRHGGLLLQLLLLIVVLSLFLIVIDCIVLVIVVVVILLGLSRQHRSLRIVYCKRAVLLTVLLELLSQNSMPFPQSCCLLLWPHLHALRHPSFHLSNFQERESFRES